MNRSRGKAFYNYNCPSSLKISPWIDWPSVLSGLTCLLHDWEAPLAAIWSDSFLFRYALLFLPFFFPLYAYLSSFPFTSTWKHKQSILIVVSPVKVGRFVRTLFLIQFHDSLSSCNWVKDLSGTCDQSLGSPRAHSPLAESDFPRPGNSIQKRASALNVNQIASRSEHSSTRKVVEQ